MAAALALRFGLRPPATSPREATTKGVPGTREIRGRPSLHVVVETPGASSPRASWERLVAGGAGGDEDNHGEEEV